MSQSGFTTVSRMYPGGISESKTMYGQTKEIPTGEKPSVLVVDDDQENLNYLSRVLRDDYRVDTALSGESALDCLDATSYAVIISDQRMPGMSGTEFLAASLEKDPNAVRIVASAYSDLDATVDAINRAQISSYLHKPFNIEQVRTAVTTAMQIRSGVVENSALVRRLEEANKLLSLTLDARSREIQRSEVRFRTLIESLPFALGVIRSGSLSFVNPRFAGYLGFVETVELVDRRLEEFIPAEQRQRFHETAATVLEDGRTQVINGQHLVGAQEKRLVAEVALLATVLDGERCLLVVARDMTEYQQTQARLMHTERMASVGMLAAGIAHEINNPLTYIIANLGFLSAEWPALVEQVRALSRSNPGPDSMSLLHTLDELQSVVDEARDGAERVRSIVRDLKTFARPQQDSTEPVDVCSTLESTINMVWNEIRQRARLIKDFQPVPKVRANETRLAQVFMNLLINAAHAIDEGDVANNAIRVNTELTDDGRVLIGIRDTGGGISKANLDMIFDPFFTTKRGEGTGLGLFLCHGIIDKLGGEISVTSTPGEGTCFNVLLPVLVPDAVPSSPTAQRRAGSEGIRGRVLVIDDEPAVARALRRMLFRSHEVLVANGGAEAKEILRHDDDFDVILCDLLMPEVSGMDLYEEVKGWGHGLEELFVFVTGSAFTERARAFIAETPRLRLDKPVDVEVLRAVVDEFIERRRGAFATR